MKCRGMYLMFGTLITLLGFPNNFVTNTTLFQAQTTKFHKMPLQTIIWNGVFRAQPEQRTFAEFWIRAYYRRLSWVLGHMQWASLQFVCSSFLPFYIYL